MRTTITAIAALPRLTSWIIDRIEYAVTSVRLAVVDRVCGPEPPTLADRRREADRERLPRAFPPLDISGKEPMC